MKKKNQKLLAMLCLGTVALTAAAQTKIDIKEYRYAGPFKVQQPVMMDSIDLSARKFGTDNLLDFPLNLDAVETGRVMHDAVLPNGENQLYLIGFTFELSKRLRRVAYSMSLAETEVESPFERRIIRLPLRFGFSSFGASGFTPASSGSMRIRPQYSQTIIFLRIRTSSWR